MPKAKDLINWGELSRILANGDRFAIRKDKVPKKYEQQVNKILKGFDKVIKDL